MLEKLCKTSGLVVISCSASGAGKCQYSKYLWIVSVPSSLYQARHLLSHFSQVVLGPNTYTLDGSFVMPAIKFWTKKGSVKWLGPTDWQCSTITHLGTTKGELCSDHRNVPLPVNQNFSKTKKNLTKIRTHGNLLKLSRIENISLTFMKS